MDDHGSHSHKTCFGAISVHGVHRPIGLHFTKSTYASPLIYVAPVFSIADILNSGELDMQAITWGTRGTLCRFGVAVFLQET